MAVTGRLPRAEIAAAIEHLAEATPDLLAAVERAAETPPEDEAEEHLVFFALHILGWAREPKLHAPLMRLLRWPEQQIDHLLGDAQTETLGSIVAGGFNGHAEDLFDLGARAGAQRVPARQRHGGDRLPHLGRTDRRGEDARFPRAIRR